MKKLMALVLAFCMVCMLVPAVAEEDITGTWYLVEMVMGEESYNPVDMGMSMTYILNDDGTLSAEMIMGGETQTQEEGTWTLDGSTVTLTQPSGETVGTLADGYIVIESDGQTGYLGREAPAATEKAQPVAAESEETFIGTWSLTGLEIMGMFLEKGKISGYGIAIEDATLTIEPGKVTAVTDMGEELGTETTNAASVFEDGKLVLTVEVPEDQAALVEQINAAMAGIAGDEAPQMDVTTATIELMDDDTIRYTTDFMGAPMSMYYAAPPAD